MTDMIGIIGSPIVMLFLKLFVPAPALWCALRAWRRCDAERVALKKRVRELESNR